MTACAVILALHKQHLLIFNFPFSNVHYLQKVWPHGNIRIGEWIGGTINSKQMAQVYYSTISQTFISIFVFSVFPNAFSAILYVN